MLIQKRQSPLGSYRRPTPRALLGLGAAAVSYERGTSVSELRRRSAASWEERVNVKLQGLLEIKDTRRPTVLR